MRYKLCTCGNVIADSSNAVCGKCGRGKAKPKRGTTESGYDGQWKKLSERFRKEHPLCMECEKQGIANAAEEVHHVIPITEAPWLRLSVSNLMALCVACHRRIDQQRRNGET